MIKNLPGLFKLTIESRECEKRIRDLRRMKNIDEYRKKYLGFCPYDNEDTMNLDEWFRIVRLIYIVPKGKVREHIRDLRLSTSPKGFCPTPAISYIFLIEFVGITREKCFRPSLKFLFDLHYILYGPPKLKNNSKKTRGSHDIDF